MFDSELTVNVEFVHYRNDSKIRLTWKQKYCSKLKRCRLEVKAEFGLSEVIWTGTEFRELLLGGNAELHEFLRENAKKKYNSLKEKAENHE